ncbi:HDOD domain-containing protein [Kaarinaea lacus]
MSAIEKQEPILDKIAEIEHLPPFPLLSNIIKSFLVANNDGDIRPLISNIETEPTIVAKVIGTANSAFFGNHFPVRSLKDAVARLGLNQLKSLVFSIIVASKFCTQSCRVFNVARFWSDAMLTANCALHISAHSKNFDFDKNEMYCIGLLHSIGLLSLVHIAPQEMAVLLSSEGDESLSSKERRQFGGIDHYDAGAAILKHWQLPLSYYETIGLLNNHSSQYKGKESVALLQRAKELLESNFAQENIELDALLGLTLESKIVIEDACENDKNWILSFADHL